MPKVLVADDSDIDLQLSERALRKAFPDWVVVSVTDGTSACLRLAEFEKPDLVLLDFKMPGMGATEIVESTNAETIQSVPIILFSSSVSPADISRCEALGVKEYVEKPMDPAAYEAAVRDICQKWVAAVNLG